MSLFEIEHALCLLKFITIQKIVHILNTNALLNIICTSTDPYLSIYTLAGYSYVLFHRMAQKIRLIIGLVT